MFAVVFAMLSPVATSDAKCARTELRPKVLTTRDRKLPDDGGILVGIENVVYSDTADHANGDPSVQPTWVAYDGAKHLGLTYVTLAPGLTVYKSTGKSTVVLKTKAGTALGTFTHDPKAAANTMAAPEPIDLVVASEPTMRGGRQRTATLRLKVAPPPAAAALVVYSAASKITVPLSFVTLPDTHDALLSLGVFDDAGKCGSVVVGSQPPEGHQLIAFAYVDAFGRVSPVSASITAK
jgi:hypothetical protein